MMIFLLLLRDILLVLALNVVFLVPNVLVDMSKWLQRLMVRGKYCLLPAIWLYITEREDSDNGAGVLLRQFPISEHPRNINKNLSLFAWSIFSLRFLFRESELRFVPGRVRANVGQSGMISCSQPGTEWQVSANERTRGRRRTNERAAAPAPAYHCSDLHNKQ